ncbi:type I secretion system permease/ATPase [Roseiarcaceae bacterium H3SJ34-1]|uniref:type I secretion system permease/ATPase n=1 Tax=Terripilifer ovatus TaxID=3032367 RepID=UPI003AB9B483|nr:type I secretion system permease/ATPase [Roseiarcaceae bacterium H3SJ34-1]
MKNPIRLQSGEMLDTLKTLRGPLIAVALVSGVINILMLSAPIFMLQVYDRVLPSRSVPTLVSLFALITVLFAFHGYFDAQRSRVLLRLGRRFEESIGPRVFDILLRSHERGSDGFDGAQALRDVDTVRGFISSPGLIAFFDMPWMFLYIVVCFLFHPLIGFTVLAAIIGFLCLTALGEIMLRRRTQEATNSGNARRQFSEMIRRNAGTIQALGLRGAMVDQWHAQNDRALGDQQTSSDIMLNFAALQRSLRMLLQSGLLGIGAWLVINQEATAGVMLASSIIAVRALTPIDILIGNWKSFIAARQSWTRLDGIIEQTPRREARTPLAAPTRSLRVTGLGLAIPATDTTVLHDINFALEAGSAMAVVGPSGSGKSSLARALVGTWRPRYGAIRLDGAKVEDWPEDSLNDHIGFMPQDIELLAGTIAQNIARFQDPIDQTALMEAAKAAFVHELILQLPQAYDTRVGEGGLKLSGGQRQRIGLARALYGNPFLVVLDEPNSNLDSQGEAALARAIASIRLRGGIAIIIAHRSSALTMVDKVLVLNEGRVQAFGARDRIFPQLVARPATVRQAPEAAPSEQAPASRRKTKTAPGE